jgi:6-phospho-beta-glucosidase
VPAVIGAHGATPVELEPLAPLYAGLVQHVSAYEELALEAAQQGGRERVFRALLAHPLIGQLDRAERLTDLLLAANAGYLPWAQ